MQVQAVYEGVQREFYELFMGQQIHVGGVGSSLELAEAGGVTSGQHGIELCCGSGASMRLLVRLFDVASMVGVELATSPVQLGQARVDAAGLAERIRFVVGDATTTALPEAEADFIWGEDAWCYVPDKSALVAEAERLLRRGGTIAFTDWVEGPAGLSDDEAEHVMQIMTFPGLQTIEGYGSLLDETGFDVVAAEDTKRFGPSFALYANMLQSQLGFDALELFDFSRDALDLVVEQLVGLSKLGDAGKLAQGRFVARKR
jgi:SAM-dependent methyltransferase